MKKRAAALYSQVRRGDGSPRFPHGANEMADPTTSDPRTKRTRFLIGTILLVLIAGGGYAWRSRRVMEKNELLFAAIEKADPEAVRTVLDLGADPNARRGPAKRQRGRPDMTGGIGIYRSARLKGATALMAAADKRPEIMRILLERGADVNLTGSDRGEWSALMYSAGSGQIENVAQLLEHGAKVNHRDQVGVSALGLAAERGNARMADLLLEYNAQPNVEDMFGMTPLLHALLRASEADRAACMETLLRHNAVPDQGIHGTTALCLAIQRDMSDAVEVLLKHNAAVNGLYVGGKSPLDLAREKGNPKVVAMLLKAGARSAEETATANTKVAKGTKNTKIDKGMERTRADRQN